MTLEAGVRYIPIVFIIYLVIFADGGRFKIDPFIVAKPVQWNKRFLYKWFHMCNFSSMLLAIIPLGSFNRAMDYILCRHGHTSFFASSLKSNVFRPWIDTNCDGFFFTISHSIVLLLRGIQRSWIRSPRLETSERYKTVDYWYKYEWMCVIFAFFGLNIIIDIIYNKKGHRSSCIKKELWSC